MRFVEDGPNIPTELLEARDAGTVVFLCGAGVSMPVGMPVGMPGFAGLTNAVIAELGADSSISDAIGSTPFDQVFNRLVIDFGRDAVLDAVSAKLKIPRNADLKNHDALLRISSNSEGVPRLVTTNFDTLFERARKRIRKYICPELPDFRALKDFDGIAYLHGRLDRSNNKRYPSDIILSSSDFGRAYLAQGWAARFVRELLQRFTVVLVGYSADDPPIRYLLEGLDLDGHRQPNKIFAFAGGDNTELTTRWRERNVEAITYPTHAGDHSALWETLRAWADRADSPKDWRNKIGHLAEKRPSELTPVERGQVCSMVSTAEGAHAFASFKPTPHPEWLCVFDANTRMADAVDANKWSKTPAFDPQIAYGLDDDPPRPTNEENSVRENPFRGATDFLTSLPGETATGSPRRISNYDRRGMEAMPSRLWHILRWISEQSASPVVLWWYVRQGAVCPQLVHQIKWKLEHPDNGYSDAFEEAWHWVLSAKSFQDDEHGFDSRAFPLAKLIKSSAWGLHSRHRLAEFLIPRLVTTKPLMRGAIPPKHDATVGEILRYEIAYPDWHGERPTIPSEHLVEIFRYARRGLVRASELISATDQYVLSSPTFYPEDRPGSPNRDDGDNHLLWVGEMFKQLCLSHSEAARLEFHSWPDDDVFFHKLRLYALAQDVAFDATDTADYLAQVRNEPFWHSRNRRDLLILLRQRWSEFSRSQRKDILSRFIGGQEKWEGEKQADFVRRRAFSIIEPFEWLQREGCELPNWAVAEVKRQKKKVPEWQEKWVENAADSYEGWGGSVGTNTDFKNLARIPLPELAAKALEETKQPHRELVDYRPFQGLVSKRLSKALAVLGHEKRHGRYPVELWRETVTAWPETANKRQRLLFARRLSELPDSVQFELRYYHTRWLREHLPNIAITDCDQALDIWDAVLSALEISGEEATASGIGETTVGGKPVLRSRRTYHYASGPISDLHEILQTALSAKKPKANARVPDTLKSRFERLWGVPGEGADHAVAMTTSQIVWFNWIDPEWVEESIIPMLALDHHMAEPAWSGCLRNRELWPKPIFKRLKPWFLKLGPKFLEWRWRDGDSDTYAAFATIGAWWHLEGGGYLTWDETRSILKSVSDSGRRSALQMVNQIVSKHDQWRRFGKPFFKKCWPRELEFQSGPVSYNMIGIAEDSGERFPDVVKTISPFLRSPDHADLFIFKMKKERGGEEEEGSELASLYPLDVLTLLDRTIPTQQQIPPYDLSSVLNLIADAHPLVRQDQRWRRLGRQAGIH